MMTTKDKLDMLAEDECPYNRHGKCRLTGYVCHISDHLDQASELNDLGCSRFTDECILPDWNLQELLAYADWYAD